MGEKRLAWHQWENSGNTSFLLRSRVWRAPNLQNFNLVLSFVPKSSQEHRGSKVCVRHATCFLCPTSETILSYKGLTEAIVWNPSRGLRVFWRQGERTEQIMCLPSQVIGSQLPPRTEGGLAQGIACLSPSLAISAEQGPETKKQRVVLQAEKPIPNSSWTCLCLRGPFWILKEVGTSCVTSS